MLQPQSNRRRATTTASRPRAPSTDEIRRIIDEQRERVAEILARRRQVLVRAAQLLLAKETISGQELRDLMTANESEPEQDTGSDAAAVPIS